MHLCPQEIAVMLMAVPFVRMVWLKIRARIRHGDA